MGKNEKFSENVRAKRSEYSQKGSHPKFREKIDFLSMDMQIDQFKCVLSNARIKKIQNREIFRFWLEKVDF